MASLNNIDAQIHVRSAQEGTISVIATRADRLLGNKRTLKTLFRRKRERLRQSGAFNEEMRSEVSYLVAPESYGLAGWNSQAAWQF
jgi:hypothetical protein